MKKRIISILLCAFLIVSAAVPGFANNLQIVSKKSFSKWDSYGITFDGNTPHIYVYLKDAPIDVQEKWKMVMGKWLNDPDYVVLFGFCTSFHGSFEVYAFPRNSTRILHNHVNMPFHVSDELYSFVFSLDVSSKQFIYDSKFSSFLTKDQHVFRLSPSYFISTDNFLLRSDLPAGHSRFSDLSAIIVTDDLDPEPPKPPTPSRPEPPPVPEIPYKPSGPPSASTGGENLPYDPAIWEAFTWYIRDAIGSVGRVLLLIVFLLSVIPLVINTIRHYAGSREDHGGNLL